MRDTKKIIFRWLLTNEIHSTQGVFNLRVFKNEDTQRYAGILKGERIGLILKMNDGAKVRIRKSAFNSYEVLGDALDELYDSAIEYINSIAGDCTDMREIEHR